MRWNTMEWDVMQWNEMEYDVMLCSAMRWNTMQCDVMLCNLMWCHSMPCDAIYKCDVMNKSLSYETIIILLLLIFHFYIALNCIVSYRILFHSIPLHLITSHCIASIYKCDVMNESLSYSIIVMLLIFIFYLYIALNCIVSYRILFHCILSCHISFYSIASYHIGSDCINI